MDRPEGRNILLGALRHMPAAFQLPLNWSHVKTALGHFLSVAVSRPIRNKSYHPEQTGLDSRYFISRPMASHLSVVGL